jgi:oxygen-independent coproporphyrinogen-3 oxidase
MSTLRERFAANPYAGYVYGYPHKTAYRPLEHAIPLQTLWARERREALFVYVHVPFCEMRCGFCNLFTRPVPKEALVAGYLDALERQARVVRGALGDVRFARIAVGGGTPTQLDATALARVLDVIQRTMGATRVPFSVETSPETASREKLALLRERGVDRVSIGVQSFLEEETRAVHRPQRREIVEAALDAIRASGVPTLNIDLMYGLPGQTEETLGASLRAALRVAPEEIYLYPTYVRPLTRLGRAGALTAYDSRPHLYQHARSFLLARGYTQVSMRMFRAAHAPRETGPAYACQEDGMVGLGCGARSYTRALHYSDEYAVGARGIDEILGAYVRRAEEAFRDARYGYALDVEDQRRRFVLLSLLAEGLDEHRYTARFECDLAATLPELLELEAESLIRREDSRWFLTPDGVELSDALGPWLFSERVRARMHEYTAR